MRLARFRTPDGEVHHGLVEDAQVRVVEGCVFGQWSPTDRTLPLVEVTLLAPVKPPNILALGLNYAEHAQESDADLPPAPLLFIKSTTTLNDPGAPIVLPRMCPHQVDYEAEQALVIGKTAKHVSQAEALDYVLGFTCGNDVSARDAQMGDGQWARGKSFDSFCPLGPWIETELDADHCGICLRLNGETLQEANTSDRIFQSAFVVSYLSHCMTLLPGTVIMTGTPSGVGFARVPPLWLQPGDVVEVEIEGLGVLRNPVIAEE